MQRYDGSIRINTKIDLKNADVQLQSLENRMVKAADKVGSLRSKMDALAKTKIPAEGYKKLEEEYGKLENKISSLAEKQKRFLETGGKTKSTAYKKMEYDLNSLEERQNYVFAKMRKMEAAGTHETSGRDTEEYARLAQQLKYAENNAELLSRRHDELSEKTRRTNSDSKGLKTTFSRLSRTIIGKLVPSFKKANKSSNNLFSGGIKNILKYAFGIRSLYMLVSKIRSGIKDGFSNLMNENEGFKHTVNDLKASLLTLKNSFAAAFSPIVSAAIPYIKQLVDWLTTAIDSIGQFIAAITGQTTYLRAIRKTAESMEDVADATEDATKAAKGYLSPLDDINKYSTNSTSGSNASNTGSGTGNSFETVPVTSTFSGIANKIKEMWEKEDFTELGKIVGNKIKNALDNIKWDDIKESTRKIAKSIGTFINGFVETDGLWGTVGNTIGQGINTAVLGVNTFLKTVHWDSVGSAITTTLYNTFKTLDFSEIGNLLSSLLIAGLDFVTGLLEGVNWKELPGLIVQKVKDLLTGFDWKGSFKSLGKLIGTAVISLEQFMEGVGEILADVGAKIKEYFVEKIKEAGWSEDNGLLENGKAIVEGILKGIWEGIKGIVKWIKENILDPFVEGFKEAFGIHSPSTVMAEYGGYIIDGLLKGIKDFFGNVIEWVKEIPGKIIEALGNLKEKFSGFVSGALELGEDVITVGIGLVKKGWSSLKEFITGKAEGVKETIETGIELVREGWTNLKDFIGSKVSVALEKAKSWSKDANFVLKTGGKTLKSVVQAAVKKSKTWVKDAWKAVKMGKKTILRTVSANVRKGIWSSPAWKATNLLASKVIRSVVQSIQKGTWNFDAIKATKMVAKTIRRIVKVSVSKFGSWSHDAFKAALTTGGYVYRYVKIAVSWIGQKLKSAWKIIAGEAEGGVLINGRWSSIPQFAGGTLNAGSMFVAGERGPEIVGHINGRTEVLNKSQIASAIYSGVLAALENGLNSIGEFLDMRMAAYTNALISSVLTVGEMIPNPIYAEVPSIDLSGYATGQIIPRSIKRQMAASTVNAESYTAAPIQMRDIKQAVESAISKLGGVNVVKRIEVPVYMNGREVTRVVVDEAKLQQMATGKNIFELS